MKKSLCLRISLLSISLCFSYYNAFGCEAELDAEVAALLDANVVELEAPVTVQKFCFPTQSIIDLLTPASNPSQSKPIINAVAILSEDIYRKTTGPITRRSLLDEPALIPDPFCNNFWTVTTGLFYNFSPRVYFTKNSPFIKDYIDLTNQNIINELANVEFINVNIPGILGLFSNIKLQQHRAGLMVGFARQWENWLITGRIPLYYLVENFYLTNEEINKIKNNPFFETEDDAVGFSLSDDVEKFALKHIVSDKFGIGDARLSILAHVVNTPYKNLWFGLQSTIPTARTWTRGLLGGEFDPDEPIPPFNLQHFFNVFFCNTTNELFRNTNQTLANKEIRDELTNFLVDTLDRLSTILINAPLGNGKHFGFGPQLDFRYTLSDYFSTHTYACIEAYTPHHESRFYLLDKTEEDLNRDWRNPALAGENLALLNRLVVSTLFPVGIVTTVRPGPKFQINQALLYKNKHWDLKFGFDYWIQGHETISPLIPEVPCNLPFNRVKANRPAAQQGKLFASAGYYDNLHNCIDWHVSLNVDGTIFHTGIGQNYSIDIRFGLEF